MTASDPFDLQRFVGAQARTYENARRELQAGEKQSHWMWFIFPQLRGLGMSPMSIRYGISSLAEAGAYLNHPVLGPRLRECTHLVLRIERRSIHQIFGDPDDMKFRSSMTLFANTPFENQIFRDALLKFFAGKPDPLTLDRLR